MIFIFFSCKSKPIDVVKNIESEFVKYETKLRDFPLTDNNGKRKTRDPEIVRSFFVLAHELVDFAETNHTTYQDNYKLLEEKTIKENLFLNVKTTAYQYSHRNLEDIEKMVLHKIKQTKSYHYDFNLNASRIFKLRPPGHKPGGSKKYDSIRKKFS